MTRRYIMLSAVVVSALLAFLAVRSGWLAPRPVLTVHLRCTADASGTLFITRSTGAGDSRGEMSVDVSTACRGRLIHLEGYRSAEDLHIRLDRGDGNPTLLTTRYGTDIQTDQDGFFAVLRIAGTPPFLANDRI